MYFFRRNGNAARLPIDFCVGVLIFLLNLHLNCSKTVNKDRSKYSSKPDSDNSIVGRCGSKDPVFIAFVRETISFGSNRFHAVFKSSSTAASSRRPYPNHLLYQRSVCKCIVAGRTRCADTQRCTPTIQHGHVLAKEI